MLQSPVKPKDTFKHMNLVDENYHVTIKDVISAIGWEYLRTTPFSVKDGGKELASLQGGFHYVNPTNGWFPGNLYSLTQVEEGKSLCSLFL